MAMKYHLGDGLVSFCCWSLAFMEPEPLRGLLSGHVPRKDFSVWGSPLLVARVRVCWLPLCFPAVPAGSFSSSLCLQSSSFGVALCVLLPGAEWWMAWGWMRPALAPCVWAFGVWLPGQLQFGYTPGHPFQSWLFALCCLESLEESLGKLIRWSDENSFSESNCRFQHHLCYWVSLVRKT